MQKSQDNLSQQSDTGMARAEHLARRNDDAASRAGNADAPGRHQPDAPGKGRAPLGPVRPHAARARVRRRHMGLTLSFLLMVLAPVVAVGIYMFGFAEDQYASNTGVTIRQEETQSATELLGGLAQFMGGSSAGTADLLFEYVQSQEIVERIEDRFGLRAHYSRTWESDPVYSVRADAPIEDLHRFWGRMIRPSFDKSTGLLLIQVRARDAEAAQRLNQIIIDESERMINELNQQARNDTMRNADADLATAVERLRAAREAVAEYRARTQIVDPAADIQGRMGVLNTLQQQLAEALVEYDLLAQSLDSADPRLRQILRRVEVIRERIAQERRSFAEQNVTVDGTDYPSLLAQYESLRVDQEFAEETYRAALAARDAARSNAERQSLYLATFIRPTLPQRADYPDRLLLIGLTALFALMIWALSVMVYYSLRDRG